MMPYLTADLEIVSLPEDAMDKWNLIFDVAKCENCNNCVLATKDEHCDNTFPGYGVPQPRHGHEWIRIERRVRGEAPMVDAAYLVSTCNHCDNAPCVAAGGGAVRKRDDGIVLIDPDKARGRKDLVKACPYGAIWWNEEHQVPQKWSFDAHLLDAGWKEPRCTQACATGALSVVKVSDAAMKEMAASQGLEVLRPELGTRPRVYYANLHRYAKCFIGGSVLADVQGRPECIEGARAVLTRDGRQVAETLTDAFGDFKFDALEPGTARYRVQVSHPAHGSAALETQLPESRYFGAIHLARAQQPAPAAATA